MKTGELVGCEALIRWQHPERGLVAPSDFLPIIEDHPLSLEVGEWVINSALAQISYWQSQGMPLSVSVNLGAMQLQDPHFVQRLSELLALYPDVSPGTLELEIVETSALADITEVAEVMRACNKLGVRFSVDDFGTGYSSLTYLKRLPAETLKIDQSFIRDMLDDPDDFAIVQGVIGLAKAFNRKVIAEGVETVAHGELLIPLGCELAQGYGIARPMPASELIEWANNWKPNPRWTRFNKNPQ
jgi:EAL domain-containing protein (putative c-di-GMP-specific phosphodiesterase class I)